MMDDCGIVIRCIDGEVVLSQMVRTRWELFDNLDECATTTQSRLRPIPVPYTLQEMSVWLEIDRGVESLVEGTLTQIRKLPFRYSTICRFFDARTPLFWLFIHMDDWSVPWLERSRRFTDTARALECAHDQYDMVRRDMNTDKWKRGAYDCYCCKGPRRLLRATLTLWDGMKEMRSSVPADLFVYDLNDGYSPVDFCFQWLHRNDPEKRSLSYGEYAALKSQCDQVNDLQTYIAVVKSLYDVILRSKKTPQQSLSFTGYKITKVGILNTIGLDALHGERLYWYVGEGGRMKREGQKFLTPFTIRGPNSQGEWREIVRSRHVRRLVDKIIEIGIGEAVLLFCQIDFRYRKVNHSLNRFSNLLEARLFTDEDADAA